MNSFRTTFTVTSIICILSSNHCYGQRLKYDNETQIRGGSAAFHAGSAVFVKKLTQLISNEYPSLMADAEQELNRWNERHEKLILASIKLKLEAYSNASSSNERAMLDDLFNNALPNMIEAQINIYSSKIKAFHGNNEGKQLCRDYLIALSEHKFDLKETDPVVFEYLSNRFKRDSSNPR